MSSPAAPAMPDMAAMMRYLPMLLQVLSEAPGVVFGFITTILAVVLFLGVSEFREGVAPVAGFHIVFFCVLRELHQSWSVGRTLSTQLRQKANRLKFFAQDIQMQYNKNLD